MTHYCYSDGSIRPYAHRRSASRHARLSSTVIVDSWRADDPPPYGSSDAATWDQYRLRRGYAGCPH